MIGEIDAAVDVLCRKKMYLLMRSRALAADAATRYSRVVCLQVQ